MLKEVIAALKEMGWIDTCLDAPDTKVNADGKTEQADPNSIKGSVKEAKIRKHIEKKRYGKGYWDDYCLAMFLRGVCLRYVAYPVCLFPRVIFSFLSFCVLCRFLSYG